MNFFYDSIFFVKNLILTKCSIKNNIMSEIHMLELLFGLKVHKSSLLFFKTLTYVLIKLCPCLIYKKDYLMIFSLTIE